MLRYAHKCTWVLLLSDFKQGWKALRNFSKTLQYKEAHGSYSWLRHYVTSLKVMGSISNEVTGFFN
jgi:hypothetical protein